MAMTSNEENCICEAGHEVKAIGQGRDPKIQRT